jgi:hypothetical protein
MMFNRSNSDWNVSVLDGERDEDTGLASNITML